MQEPIHDMVIVGLGPAGASCALEARHHKLSVLAVGDEPVGGLLRAARRLDNIPKMPGITGNKLANQMEQQLIPLGIPILNDRVQSVTKQWKMFFFYTRNQQTFCGRTVCFATGTRPRSWDVLPDHPPVLRDARGLPPSLKEKRVIILGGGEMALDTSLSAADRGGLVTVLVRSPHPKTNPSLLSEVQRSGVSIQFLSDVRRIFRVPEQWRVVLASGIVLETDCLVACIGRDPKNEIFGHLPSSFAPGVFFAGDVVRPSHERFATNAIDDGIHAARSAAQFLGRIE
jgi:thioredoxin reductase